MGTSGGESAAWKEGSAAAVGLVAGSSVGGPLQGWIWCHRLDWAVHLTRRITATLCSTAEYPRPPSISGCPGADGCTTE